jgi:hypothetical protein
MSSLSSKTAAATAISSQAQPTTPSSMHEHRYQRTSGQSFEANGQGFGEIFSLSRFCASGNVDKNSGGALTSVSQTATAGE